eukprot:CAMPEP_0171311584 /NCGR_PEP_ID=MMETSP0816-20121228/21854_1 /TAXON_ID=420281 /ORGANISM="Proboscia inermis, Strain CCAP1064/1" /LENGTH=58 /DNA_ID=CAMNT_0011796453 /DNA_START=522 /DNA_END=698 /DNA_ORIENTATION=+
MCESGCCKDTYPYPDGYPTKRGSCDTDTTPTNIPTTSYPTSEITFDARGTDQPTQDLL